MGMSVTNYLRIDGETYEVLKTLKLFHPSDKIEHHVFCTGVTADVELAFKDYDSLARFQQKLLRLHAASENPDVPHEIDETGWVRFPDFDDYIWFKLKYL